MMLDVLRRETRGLHERVEQNRRLRRLTEPDLMLREYAEILMLLYGFYEPLEDRLAQIGAAESLALDLEERRKVPLLHRDLRALDVAPAAIASLPACPYVPDPASRAQALGCLYVLEGATLGGKIISRHLGRVLGLRASNGAAFYNSYGARIGPMWKALCATIEAQCPPDRVPDLVHSACETFEKLDRWLASGHEVAGRTPRRRAAY